MAVSSADFFKKHFTFTLESRTHFAEDPYGFFLFDFASILLIKCINIILIFGHHTWIHTYKDLYYHIDIVFSQLRKKCPFLYNL